jgi:hypothetical protein
MTIPDQKYIILWKLGPKVAQISFEDEERAKYFYNEDLSKIYSH